MNVGIAYDNGRKQVWLKLEVPDGSTVREVIDLSKLIEMFPEIDLDTQKVGIFGKATKLDAVVTDCLLYTSPSPRDQRPNLVCRLLQ